MESLEYIETAIANFERLINLPITIVDHNGLFQFKQKSKVFNDWRRSHHKLPVCYAGFCPDCVANCRYRLNQLCIAQPKPHYTVCWKNIAQIAVPLRHEDFHYGVLYAGVFKPQGGTVPKGLPDEFYTEYASLRQIDEASLAQYMSILEIFARGLISYLCEENILNFDYDLRVRKLGEYLEAHYQEQLTLNDIARHLALSEAYTSSFIKKNTGSNFSELLRSIRINHAKKMLATTEDTLRSIAEACGFSSEFHLSKVFKQQTSESPSAFRKRSLPSPQRQN